MNPTDAMPSITAIHGYGLVALFVIVSIVRGILYEITVSSRRAWISRSDIEFWPGKYNLDNGEPSPEHFSSRGIKAIKTNRAIGRIYLALMVGYFLWFLSLFFI